MTPKKHLQRAIDLAGNANRLAEKTGGKTTASHVFNWLNRDRDGVSPQSVIAVCRAVDFQVTPHQLRPDIYPNTSDGMPTKPKKSAA
jgi:DNA-binding transcriptional regulator YdaS (Cro superfamily)